MTDIEILESLKSYTCKPKILDKAIRSIEAWEHLNNKIQFIKTMKEQELPIAWDLTTAYILRGEIDMLEVVSALMTEQFSEVENADR